MSDFLTVVKDNALAITTLVGVFTIMGASIGFWLNFRLSRKKLESDKKALRQQMITNNIAPMRQAWINDVRERASNFIHQSKVLRMILFSAISDTLNLTQEQKKERENNASIIYYQLNESAQYLDLILPYSIDGDRSETEADNLRKNIMDIIDIFDSIFIEIDSRNTGGIDDHLNKILSTTELASKNTKSVLLKEWRETKSLKEIE